MTKKVINIIKLCVGAQNVSELYNWQKNRIISVANLEDPVTFIITRMRPKKEEDSKWRIDLLGIQRINIS